MFMRFYCESIETESVLDPVESHHLCRVLRAQKGTPVELFDGKGTLAEGVVERSDKKHAVIRIQTVTQTPPSTSGRLVLAVSFAKSPRFDWLMEKCTELGADHIAAVQFDRSVKLGKDTAMERYRKISVTAAKQSGRLFLPVITGPAKLQATLDDLTRQYPQSHLLYGEPDGGPLPESLENHPTPDCIVLVGPEGGLTDDEKHLLSKAGATGVSINKNILRIETAAMAFCSILSSGRS
jgi:16S rRNA (uracil1498-N3)-methyltransferase